ncbi:hypothetical protein [Planktotalea sp.]|uniref:hypothetical protein n=1 Tax=Planktotalea sp. TaxID=2029877 RepID=UPI0032998A1B
MPTISITSITCLATSGDHADSNSNDEVWLLALSDNKAPVRYPSAPLTAQSMNTTADPDKGVVVTWGINGDLVLTCDECVNLTLYEQDFYLDLDATDYLGNTKFASDGDIPTSPVIVTNGSQSRYQIDFEVLQS